jgi:hypothetical protein
VARVLYPASRVGWLTNDMCWTKGVHRVQAWRGASFAPLHTTVQNLIDAGGVLVASSQPLVTSVTANGACDADDAYFTSIAEGPVIPALTIAQTSGPTGGAELPTDQQRLVCWLSDGDELPLTPHGRPVTVEWSKLATRIFIP